MIYYEVIGYKLITNSHKCLHMVIFDCKRSHVYSGKGFSDLNETKMRQDEAEIM